MQSIQWALQAESDIMRYSLHYKVNHQLFLTKRCITACNSSESPVSSGLLQKPPVSSASRDGSLTLPAPAGNVQTTNLAQRIYISCTSPTLRWQEKGPPLYNLILSAEKQQQQEQERRN